MISYHYITKLSYRTVAHRGSLCRCCVLLVGSYHIYGLMLQYFMKSHHLQSLTEWVHWPIHGLLASTEEMSEFLTLGIQQSNNCHTVHWINIVLCMYPYIELFWRRLSDKISFLYLYSFMKMGIFQHIFSKQLLNTGRISCDVQHCFVLQKISHYFQRVERWVWTLNLRTHDWASTESLHDPVFHITWL